MSGSAGARVVGTARRLRAGLRAALARTPLRLRLVAALVIVVIAALGGAGAATAATLQTYLTGRVDAQLRSVEPQIAEHQITDVTGARDGGGSGRGGDRSDSSGAGGDNGRGLPSAYVIAVTGSSGKLVLGPTSYLADPGQPLPRFPDFTGAETARSGTRYLTSGAERGDGSWRLLATPVSLADGSTGTLLIAQSLDDVQNTVDRLTILLAVIGAVAVVVLAGVGYLIVRASLRPLREVERTAAYVAAGDLSHRVPDAHAGTEVGQLSAALNTMLAEIETAFADRARSEAAARRSEDRMRRFVADASHELRTPLTSIRGFAELYRQGAASTTTAVERIMGRIESEAQRMGLLVEDLLLLARLDRERPIARVPVDLLALATDAVHDARAIAPDREITLAVDPAGGPPVVLGDEQRLRQVVGNLMANALEHTPAGTAVRVRLATDSVAPADQLATGTAVLEVADDGPGLTAEQSARVFERFYRADAARGSDGGTGLGLAIVSALVAGHAGRVEVDSEAGHGARFRVRLALAPVGHLPG